MAVLVLEDCVPLDHKRRKTWIYAARIIKDGTIKIGITANAHLRMSLLRAQRGSKVELIGITPGARINEKLAHKRLAASGERNEFFFDTTEVQDFIKTHLQPADRWGVVVKCSDKEFGLIKRDSVAHNPNPENISRYITRILNAGEQEREVLSLRLVNYISYGKYFDWWKFAVSEMRDRLNIDLVTSSRRSDRRVVYFSHSEAAA